MTKITDKQLDDLIRGLTMCKNDGITDPWVFNDGEVVEPLHVLIELQEFRKYHILHE